MLYSAVFLAATAFSGLSHAQSTNETGTGPTIDAGSVPYAQRQGWCRTQTETCPQICGGRFDSNNCDPNTLTFSCICSDGKSPNTSDYEQTLPGFVCRTYKDQCVARNPNDLAAQTACLDIQCGTKLATGDSSSSSSSSASATASASSTGSGSSEASQTASSTGSDQSASQTASQSGSSATAASAAAALNLASTYGTGVLAAGILAAFGLAL